MNVLQVTPMGTNVNVMRLMWAMLNGSFLKSRGAIHSALKESGFEDEELRRSWWSFRYGSWDITSLLGSWQEKWKGMGGKKVRRVPSEKHRYHRVLATEAARKVNRLYNSTARRALPALIFSDDKLGEIGGKRVPLLKAIMRCTVGTKESEFRKKAADRDEEITGVRRSGGGRCRVYNQRNARKRHRPICPAGSH
ncbi:hypothetical protein KFU94_43485 [Chloroflexi bacterium TSY]|nr:hypothetical protein [Chloroflexi bacterium TSY]